MMKASDIPFALMGHVSKGEIRIDDRSFGNIKEYKQIYNNTLSKKLR